MICGKEYYPMQPIANEIDSPFNVLRTRKGAVFFQVIKDKNLSERQRKQVFIFCFHLFLNRQKEDR
jgi:hypothetical protein